MTGPADRAAAAESAVRRRHLCRLWGLPRTALGRSGWPPDLGQRAHLHWNYWWQAHLLDCLVDAQLRDPRPDRLVLIDRFVSTVRLRNHGRWTNEFYDDISWLGLALQRVRAVGGRDDDAAIRVILNRLREGFTAEGGGGIWWKQGDRFKNAPANGPAAVLHARAGDRERAAELWRWMSRHLVDPASGIVWDGLRVDTGETVKLVYTYCQGVYLGACLELSEVDAAVRTVAAVAEWCVEDGVLRGQSGGDGGLFAGILARYLALAAAVLPGDAAETARDLVVTSARACWDGASAAPGGPLFGSDWSRPAPSVDEVRADPARDLSVQVGAWMLLEAAATCEVP